MPMPEVDAKKQTSVDTIKLQESLLKVKEFGLEGDGTSLSLSNASGIKKSTSINAALNLWKSSAKRVSDYKKGEEETIRRVLERIELVSLKRMDEGLNEFNFSLGVFNCFFIAYMFGAHPEHLWLIYLVEGVYFIPRKFRNMWNAKPLNEALYYLDFWYVFSVCALVCASDSTNYSLGCSTLQLVHEFHRCTRDRAARRQGAAGRRRSG